MAKKMGMKDGSGSKDKGAHSKALKEGMASGKPGKQQMPHVGKRSYK